MSVGPSMYIPILEIEKQVRACEMAAFGLPSTRATLAGRFFTNHYCKGSRNSNGNDSVGLQVHL